MTDTRRQLSPELVLVSSELAELVRAALPDRPWQDFVRSPAPTVGMISATSGERSVRAEPSPGPA